MNESEKQFSFTRAALSTCGRAKSKFLSEFPGRSSRPRLKGVTGSPYCCRILTFAFLSGLLFGPGTTFGATLYVWANSPSPASPYTNWDTAARTIQAAVDAAQTGDTVLVTNGAYNTGGRAVFGTMTNRVAIDKAITVQSGNGPGVTLIVGTGAGGSTTNGHGAIRCVYVGANAVLSGFTLTNGHTRNYLGDLDNEQSGGGVWCETNGVATNCALTGNSAYYVGGGSRGGTLNNCTLTGNSTFWNSGGGSYGSTLNNCILTSNSVSGYGACGGGAAACALSNCTLTGNSATGSQSYGGGANGGTLNNCTLVGNSASFYGGGAANGTLSNCTLTGNSAYAGGGADGGTLNNCTLTGNSASSGGGAYFGTLNNCILTSNSASSGGGAANGTLNNCTLTGNLASNNDGGAANGTLSNCIVYYNTAPNGSNYSGSTFSYSCTSPLPSGPGNITNAPMFVDQTTGNFRLQPGSPCINAGNDSVVRPGWRDLDGNPRVSYAHVDIGAYEFIDTRPPAFAGLIFTTNTVARSGSISVSISLAPNYNTPSFQWFLNGSTVLPGHTSSNLVLNPARLADTGIYSVVVSNCNGSVTGAVMRLNVSFRMDNPALTLSNSNFKVDLDGESGMALWLEACTNLACPQWQAVGGVTNFAGQVHLTDTNASTAERYYRAWCAPWP